MKAKKTCQECAVAAKHAALLARELRVANNELNLLRTFSGIEEIRTREIVRDELRLIEERRAIAQRKSIEADIKAMTGRHVGGFGSTDTSSGCVECGNDYAKGYCPHKKENQ